MLDVVEFWYGAGFIGITGREAPFVVVVVDDVEEVLVFNVVNVVVVGAICGLPAAWLVDVDVVELLVVVLTL